ncbi:MAG: triose-phosphate isomerase [Gammaproteobacteria bacterium]|nr:triose-phosphate isomerase [Gammaproteobacteria bacterium]
MNRVKIAAGNWKMFGNSVQNAELFNAFHAVATDIGGEVMIFAPFVYIPELLALKKQNNSKVVIGAQNICDQAQGAYTGEISAAMLADIGCSHVLVGHSERRSIYQETNAATAEKYELALNNGLMPILCVGETLEQREAEQTMAVVLSQIDAVAEKVGFETLCNTIIAYEPVWAIGTGKTASPDQAQEVHAAIRAHLRAQVGDNAEKTRILYGGSVNASNADELFAMTDIDGGLVGGASLKADGFTVICNAAG